jgi:hypothetical protein
MSDDIQIAVENTDMDRNQLADAVDREIQSFNDWFISTFEGAEPLARFEKAILKTYLMLKLENSAQQP